jgi:hypothetical protein
MYPELLWLSIAQLTPVIIFLGKKRKKKTDKRKGKDGVMSSDFLSFV